MWGSREDLEQTAVAEDVLYVHRDEALLLLEDLDNGQEYYLAQIDQFSWQEHVYVALRAYEPDDGAHRSPEFVLMRYEETQSGEQLYQSIRDPKELQAVFNVFFERYLEQL